MPLCLESAYGRDISVVIADRVVTTKRLQFFEFAASNAVDVRAVPIAPAVHRDYQGVIETAGQIRRSCMGVVMLIVFDGCGNAELFAQNLVQTSAALTVYGFSQCIVGLAQPRHVGNEPAELGS